MADLSHVITLFHSLTSRALHLQLNHFQHDQICSDWAVAYHALLSLQIPCFPYINLLYPLQTLFTRYSACISLLILGEPSTLFTLYKAYISLPTLCKPSALFALYSAYINLLHPL